MNSEDCTGKHLRFLPFPKPEACEQCGSTSEFRWDWVKSMMKDDEELAHICSDCGHAHCQHDTDDCEGC